MNAVLTLNHIVARLALEANLSQEEAHDFVICFFSTIETAIASNNSVQIKGLGIFIKENGTVEFKPDAEFAAKVNEPFEMFSPITLDAEVDMNLLEIADVPPTDDESAESEEQPQPEEPTPTEESASVTVSEIPESHDNPDNPEGAEDQDNIVPPPLPEGENIKDSEYKGQAISGATPPPYNPARFTPPPIPVQPEPETSEQISSEQTEQPTPPEIPHAYGQEDADSEVVEETSIETTTVLYTADSPEPNEWSAEADAPETSDIQYDSVPEQRHKGVSRCCVVVWSLIALIVGIVGGICLVLYVLPNLIK